MVTVKFATTIIGISSIQLLKTFVNAAQYDEKTLPWQPMIHLTFVVSALAIAYTEKITKSTHKTHRPAHLDTPVAADSTGAH